MSVETVDTSYSKLAKHCIGIITIVTVGYNNRVISEILMRIVSGRRKRPVKVRDGKNIFLARYILPRKFLAPFFAAKIMKICIFFKNKFAHYALGH